MSEAKEHSVTGNTTAETKWAIVIDASLPLGIIANTAAVLSLSLGKAIPELIGHDLVDADDLPHLGITRLAMPILKGDGHLLNELRQAARCYADELTVVDLTSATLNTKSYEDYAAALSKTPAERVEYLGLALYGRKKLVNKFTGNLGLLR